MNISLLNIIAGSPLAVMSLQARSWTPTPALLQLLQAHLDFLRFRQPDLGAALHQHYFICSSSKPGFLVTSAPRPAQPQAPDSHLLWPTGTRPCPPTSSSISLSFYLFVHHFPHRGSSFMSSDSLFFPTPGNLMLLRFSSF